MVIMLILDRTVYPDIVIFCCLFDGLIKYFVLKKNVSNHTIILLIKVLRFYLLIGFVIIIVSGNMLFI